MPTLSATFDFIIQVVREFKEIILATAGVFIGFALSIGHDHVKDRKKRQELKKSVLHELYQLKKQIPDIVQICKKAIAGLQERKVLPCQCVKPISSVYSNAIRDIVYALSIEELVDLHYIHEQMRICEDFLAHFEDRIKDDIGHGLENPHAIYKIQFMELLSVLTRTENLIARYLEIHKYKPKQNASSALRRG